MRIQSITAGILPSRLLWRDIDWPHSLGALALPPSLTRLDVGCLLNLPICAHNLPPNLHTLRLSAAEFHPQHLAGALPSSLRVLRLLYVLPVPPTPSC